MGKSKNEYFQIHFLYMCVKNLSIKIGNLLKVIMQTLASLKNNWKNNFYPYIHIFQIIKKN